MANAPRESEADFNGVAGRCQGCEDAPVGMAVVHDDGCPRREEIRSNVGNSVDSQTETLFTEVVPETTNLNSDREVAMSKFFVTCPCGCGEAVEATNEGFTATTVTVAACTTWAANGIRSSKVRKTWAFGHAVVTEVPAVQHVDGLVVFA